MSDTRRAYRLLLLLGLAALAVAATCFALLSRQSPAGEPPQRPAAGPPVSGLSVVCFGRVDLPDGVATLGPLQPARVVKVLVREHEEVAAGTPLLMLDDALVRPRLRAAEAAVKAARAQLAKARLLPAQHKAKLAQQGSAVAALEQRIAAAGSALAYKQKLRASDMVGVEELAIAQAQLKEAEALRDVEKSKLEELRLYDPQLDVQAAQAESDRADARQAEAQQALAECRLTAPQDGMVLRIQAAPGNVVGGLTQPPAIYFAASKSRIIRAEVEQEFASRVALGQLVTVQDEASELVLCRGKVTALSDWYTQRRAPLLEPTRFNSTRTLECLITPDPGHPTLHLGQRVSVRFGTAP